MRLKKLYIVEVHTFCSPDSNYLPAGSPLESNTQSNNKNGLTCAILLHVVGVFREAGKASTIA